MNEKELKLESAECKMEIDYRNKVCLEESMAKIGLIVNPIAGIGSKVGLKGSDGIETLKKAWKLGAVPESGKKAAIALHVLKSAEDFTEIFTCPGEMGENACKAAGVVCKVITLSNNMTSADTVRAARAFLAIGVKLILFAGGDGTARDIMEAVGTSVTVLGIPTGCKIHSGVYALNPQKAGALAARYVQGKVREIKEAEVMDIDEEQFRMGRVQSRLYGYLKIPKETRMVQNLKSGSGYSEQGSIERLSDYIADTWDKEALYIVGGGSTTASIMKKMNLPYTLLGIDLVYGGRVIAADCTEKEILDLIEKYALDKIKILITVIGGQGYLFGRGNQQISDKVIMRVGKENIIVAASSDKMLTFLGKSLYVDTGNDEVNRYLTGYMRVVVGYGEYVVMKVSD